MAENLRTFVKKTGPEIERINASLTEISQMTLGSITGAGASEAFREDLENATKGLHRYNRMFGSTNHHLAMMTSRFTLRSFMQENGIPLEFMQQFQRDIEEHWNETYGRIGEKWWEIHNMLDKLRETLDREVYLMSKIGDRTYFDGFDRAAELRALFQVERQLFWKIVHEMNKDEKLLNEVRARCNTQMRKARYALKAHLSKAKQGIQQARSDLATDVAESEGVLRKSLVVLIYLMGSLSIVLDMMTAAANAKGILISKGAAHGVGFLKNKLLQAGAKKRNGLKEREIRRLKIRCEAIERGFNDMLDRGAEAAAKSILAATETPIPKLG